MDWLDDFWNDILSEEPLRIMAAWMPLDEESQAAIFEHLTNMANDEGWADVQRVSAQAALDTIGDQDIKT